MNRLQQHHLLLSGANKIETSAISNKNSNGSPKIVFRIFIVLFLFCSICFGVITLSKRSHTESTVPNKQDPSIESRDIQFKEVKCSAASLNNSMFPFTNEIKNYVRTITPQVLRLATTKTANEFGTNTKNYVRNLSINVLRQRLVRIAHLIDHTKLDILNTSNEYTIDTFAAEFQIESLENSTVCFSLGIQSRSKRNVLGAVYMFVTGYLKRLLIRTIVSFVLQNQCEHNSAKIDCTEACNQIFEMFVNPIDC